MPARVSRLRSGGSNFEDFYNLHTSLTPFSTKNTSRRNKFGNTGQNNGSKQRKSRKISQKKLTCSRSPFSTPEFEANSLDFLEASRLKDRCPVADDARLRACPRPTLGRTRYSPENGRKIRSRSIFQPVVFV